MTFESDIEPYAVERDIGIVKLAGTHKVKVEQRLSNTIYDPYLILKRNLGKPVITYQKFLSIVEGMVVRSPLPPPKKLSAKTHPLKDSLELENSNCYDPPSLQELHVDESKLGPNLYPGGEQEALNRMEKYLKKTKWICDFEKPKTSPNSLEPSTTVLSPYLKFGCLSATLFYTKLKEILQKNRSHSKPPVSLMGQLMWREFYCAIGAVVPNFDQMNGNTVCLQIPWKTDKKLLEAWTFGRTGYPFIDAIMRQLRLEGWIHHLARHAVACFLTRGDLWQSWEEGQKVFEELLLDADWALNAGNWMWLSASAFFHQFYRVYSPIAFGKKTDPDGKYIRKYVPELKSYPNTFIYEPWKAPLKLQQELGCVIGKDYPNRVIIHEDVYKVNIAKMSDAYKANKLAKESIKDDPYSRPTSSGSVKRKIKTETPSPSASKNKITKFFNKK